MAAAWWHRWHGIAGNGGSHQQQTGSGEEMASKMKAASEMKAAASWRRNGGENGAGG
jgi:hypothetical protein